MFARATRRLLSPYKRVRHEVRSPFSLSFFSSSILKAFPRSLSLFLSLFLTFCSFLHFFAVSLLQCECSATHRDPFPRVQRALALPTVALHINNDHRLPQSSPRKTLHHYFSLLRSSSQWILPINPIPRR